MTGLLQDFRYALRQLRKNQGFFAIGALTLAIAIGANTAIFSVVNGFLLRRPQVPDPDRLLVISSVNLAERAADRFPASALDFVDWQSEATSFTSMAAASFEDFTVSRDKIPERVAGASVSRDFFQVMGVAPALGRSIKEAEPDPVVVISDALWRSRFSAARDVLGRTMRVNGIDRTIVGVMPPTFRNWEFIADLWVPVKFSALELAPAARSSRLFNVFARLKPGITIAQANQEMSAITQRMAAALPETNKGWGTSVMSLQQFSLIDSGTRTPLIFLMGTVGFVLLIACANVACLLLSRSAARAQEFVTRAVLGAGRLRLARQMLAECLCLSLTAGGLGVLLGMLGIGIIRRRLNWSPDAVVWAREIFIDRNVLLFTLGVATVAAIFFGLFPAFQIARRDPASGGAEPSRWATAGAQQQRLQKLLVVGQLALSLVLFVGAGLFVEGFIEEMQERTGFNDHNLLTAAISVRGPAYDHWGQQQRSFYLNLLDNLRSDSQVESAVVSDALPFNFPPQTDFTLEAGAGKAEQKANSGDVLVSPGYFGALQIPVLEGREFALSDNANSSPVVVVNRAFAKRYIGTADPIGRHIRIEGERNASGQWSEIVGLVGDVEEFMGQPAPRPHIFEPFLAHPVAGMNLIVRTRTAPETFISSLRSAVAAVDSDQALTNVRTMRRVINDSGGGDDLMSGLMSAFAFISLTMAAIGTYGVLSYNVSQRTREIGIRIAVGAKPAEVRRMVVRSGAALAGTGVLIGVLASLMMPKLMLAAFTTLRFHSTFVITIAPVSVLLIALAACYVPARRAAKVDPMVALRYE